MALRDIADTLVAANRENKTADLLANHYAADAVSVEATSMDPSQSRTSEGLEAIRGKHAWWESAMTVHSAKVEGPFLHGEDRFAVIYEIDATEKESGRRNEMREVAIYHVKDDKIVREEFFYPF